MTSAKTIWSVGAALVALVLVAGSWMLLLAPRLDATASLTEQREAAEARGDELVRTAAALAREYQDIDAMRAELATLLVQFPSEVELPEFTRSLSALVDSTGATVTSVRVGSARAVGSAPEMPDARDGTAAPVLPVPPPGMYAVPIDLSVTGTVDQAKEFASALQAPTGRLFLLTRLSWSTPDEAGTAQFALSGFTYVLADAGATEAG